jgi:hypothetical protein
MVVCSLSETGSILTLEFLLAGISQIKLISLHMDPSGMPCTIKQRSECVNYPPIPSAGPLP